MLLPLSPHTVHVLINLLLVYLSWGSVFLSIKLALVSFPPFMMCGIRMLVAGVLLYAITWLTGERAVPTRADLRRIFLLAFFMVFVASGFLSKGQETVPSGTSALMLGSIPVWLVLGGWLICHEPRPSKLQVIGLLLGFSGLVLLSIRQNLSAGGTTGMLLILLAAFGWVVGSLYSKLRKEQTHLSVFRNSAIMMTFGGIQSLVWAACTGEFSAFSVDNVTSQAMLALGYMIIIGSIVGYTCYFWLLVHTRTEVAISYEYVNPIIGVFLGWLLAGEPVNGTIIAACLLTVTSVFFVVSHNNRASKERAE